jgi:hypothetical protein
MNKGCKCFKTIEFYSAIAITPIALVFIYSFIYSQRYHCWVFLFLNDYRFVRVSAFHIHLFQLSTSKWRGVLFRLPEATEVLNLFGLGIGGSKRKVKFQIGSS